MRSLIRRAIAVASVATACVSEPGYASDAALSQYCGKEVGEGPEDLALIDQEFFDELQTVADERGREAAAEWASEEYGPLSDEHLIALRDVYSEYLLAGDHRQSEDILLKSIDILCSRYGQSGFSSAPQLEDLLLDLAGVYQDTSRFTDEENALRAIYALYDSHDYWSIESRIAQSLYKQGRHSEALDYYRRSLSGRYDAGVAWAMSLSLSQLGRHQEAIETLEHAATRADLEVTRGIILEAISANYAALGLNSTARDYGDMADTVHGASTQDIMRDSLEGENSVLLLAERQLQERRYSEAAETFSIVLEVFDDSEERAHVNYRVLPSQIGLGHALRELGNLSESAQVLATAVSGAERELGISSTQFLVATAQLAETQIAQSEGSDGYETLRTAANKLRERRLGLGFEPQGALEEIRSDLSHVYPALAMLRVAWQRYGGGGANGSGSEFYDAFLAAQDVSSTSTNRAISRMMAREAASSDELRRLSRQRQMLEDEWIRLESAKLTALLGVDPSGKLSGTRERQEEIYSALLVLDENLREAFPAYFEFVRPRSLTADEVRRHLRTDEAILMAVPTPDGTYVIAVGPEGEALHRSPLTQEAIRIAVDELRGQLRPRGTSSDAFDMETANRLFRELIKPVEHVLVGKEHVFVVPVGPLLSLPFSVLVATMPNLAALSEHDAYRRAEWLSDRFSLAHLPSIQTLALLRRFSPSRRKGEGGYINFAGFGDPLLSGRPECDGNPIESQNSIQDFFGLSGSATRMADQSAIRALCPLPGTAEEVRQIANALGAPESSIRLREKATETAVVTSDLTDADVIVFATHGVLAGVIEGAGEPGLVFTPPAVASERDDGFLAASEVAKLNLKADWVILSACDTAAGDEKSSTGLSGLARSFFYAGAKSLLVSHWPVYDLIAARLTAETVQGAFGAEERTRAQALRSAMRAVRLDEENPELSHPTFWAPFTLVGETR